MNKLEIQIIQQIYFARISAKLKNHPKKQPEEQCLTIESMFSNINRLPEIYENSNSAEKNAILKYVISNSLQTDQKAELHVQKPFVH